MTVRRWRIMGETVEAEELFLRANPDVARLLDIVANPKEHEPKVWRSAFDVLFEREVAP
jgi:hypothetical protein